MMLNQTDLKTLIPAIVAPCVLLYESISGNHVSEPAQTALTNGILIGAGFVISIWGIYKNHQKKPPDVQTPSVQTPSKADVKINQAAPTTPIVTQTDLNNQMKG